MKPSVVLEALLLWVQFAGVICSTSGLMTCEFSVPSRPLSNLVRDRFKISTIAVCLSLINKFGGNQGKLGAGTIQNWMKKLKSACQRAICDKNFLQKKELIQLSYNCSHKATNNKFLTLKVLVLLEAQMDICFIGQQLSYKTLSNLYVANVQKSVFLKAIDVLWKRVTIFLRHF